MKKISKTILIAAVIVVFIMIGTAVINRKNIFRQFYKPTPTMTQEGVKISDGETQVKKTEKKDFEIIAENLQIPWEIAFLPDGDLLVTERPGTLKRIGKEKQTYPVEGVEHIGEGGLLGMALHPEFPDNRWIYLYLTAKAGNSFKNKVERYRFLDDRLFEKEIIIDNIPGAIYHDGGRIAFDAYGYLHITTGDAGNSDLAQNINSLAGKILRVKDDGSIPPDNPFGNAMYSIGHRNPQGLAWDNKGRLWATEHGRSGLVSGLDELNLIEKGANYGWPIIQGDEERQGMKTPIINSGPNETWAPAGAIYLNERIFFTGLRGESLYEAKIFPDGKVEYLKAHFREEFGRLRAIQKGPDGYLYFTTSNTDGRGAPHLNDDKIIRINPEIFF